MKATHGILVAVPVPADVAIPHDVAEKAILQATEEANNQGIHGKAVTPFVLSRVVALTEGTSMIANRALLVNNGRTAALIAVAYTS